MKVLAVLLALAALTLYVEAKNVVCGSKTTSKTVTVEDGDSYIFKTHKGKKYKANTECTVDYKMGDTCTEMSFVCSKFNTNNKDKKKCSKGDKVTVTADGKSKAYCKKKKPKVTSTGDLSVVFTSDAKKHSSGASCKVTCTEAAATGTTTGHVSSTVAPPVPDLVSNGDFSTGSLSPWSCRQAVCQVTDNVLHITERTAEWSGISQDLPVEVFTNEDDLGVTFEFQIKSPEAITAKWKVKVTNSGETKYFTIHTVDVDNQDWESIFSKLSLPRNVLGSDQVQLYIEVTPAGADINLDNISLKPEENQTGDWKEEANQRIDVLRKRNVGINLNLDFINPADVQIEIEQKNHKFPFGAAVKSPRIAECYDAGEDNRYCEFVRDNFNWMVDTYRMKWKPMEPVQGYNDTEIADKMIAWAHSYEKTVRGHALLWAKRDNNPAWVRDLYGEEMKTAIFNRVHFAIKYFEEYNIPHWDVINEMIGHTFYLDHTGDPEIREKVFKYAKELSPDTLLFLNDYGVIMNKHGRFTLYQQQIRELLAAGAPIDAIGLQSHMNGDEFVDVDLIKYHVDQLWEEFGLPIWVTEFDWNGKNDVDMGDHSYHAEQVENFYRLMFSHEAVNGIIMWRLNVLDELTDVPNNAGEAYQRLYHQEWRSSQVIQAAAEGNTFRGFLGDYSIKLLQGSAVLGEIEFTLDTDLEITCTGDASNVICA